MSLRRFIAVGAATLVVSQAASAGDVITPLDTIFVRQQGVSAGSTDPLAVVYDPCPTDTAELPSVQLSNGDELAHDTWEPFANSEACAWIWQPATPWPEGSFELTVVGATGQVGTWSLWSQNIDPERGLLIESMIEWEEVRIPSSGCEGWDPDSGAHPFFWTVSHRPRIRSSVRGNIQKYHLSFELEDGGDPVEYWGGGGAVMVNVEDEGDEVCFQWTAELLDGSGEPEIFKDCLDLNSERPSAFQLETNTPLTEMGPCTSPPEEYKAEWCAFFEPAFSEESCGAFETSDGCFAARRQCPGGDNPTESDEATERAEAAAMDFAETHEIVGENEGSGISEAGGCSINAWRKSGSPWPLALLLVTFGYAARRLNSRKHAPDFRS